MACIACEGKQGRATNFSRVDVIASVGRRVCALPTVWAYGCADGVDDVLREKKLRGVRAPGSRRVVR